MIACCISVPVAGERVIVVSRARGLRVVASGGVELVGQTVDDAVGASQKPVEHVEEIVDAGEPGGVSNKPPLSMRHEGH